MWTIQLPLSVPVSKKKDFILNLNRYRNAHFQVLNKAKVAFAKIVGRRLHGVPRLTRCTLEYVYYPGTVQASDTNNVCTVTDKFFADTLVSEKKLEDDSPEFLVGTLFRFGSLDRKNPRVDVIIRSANATPLAHPEPVTESRKAMKITTLITLTASDVETALRKYLTEEGVVAAGATVELQQAQDGSYEVRLEQSLNEPKETPRRGRQPRLEPTEAIRAAKSAQTLTHKTEPEQPSAPAATEGKDHTEAPSQVKEDVAPTDAATEQPATGEAPTTPSVARPPKTGGLFEGFTRPKNP